MPPLLAGDNALFISAGCNNPMHQVAGRAGIFAGPTEDSSSNVHQRRPADFGVKAARRVTTNQTLSGGIPSS
jgi:hypothetical protein